MKRQKKDKLKRIKSILDVKLKEDKKNKSKKGRSLDLWLMIINSQLPSIFRPNNNRELAGLFKFFKFSKGTSETTDNGCFRRIIFYRYKGGYNNEKTKQTFSN